MDETTVERLRKLKSGLQHVAVSARPVKLKFANAPPVANEIEWSVFKIPQLTDLDRELADLIMVFAIPAEITHGVYLYSPTPLAMSDGRVVGVDAEPPVIASGVTFIWDARERHGVIPITAYDDAGQRLTLVAASRVPQILAWPVERNARVFIDLTITRSLQIARGELDELASRFPDAYGLLLHDNGDAETLVDQHAQRSLTLVYPDVARVTDAMHTAIHARESERLETLAKRIMQSLADGLADERVRGPDGVDVRVQAGDDAEARATVAAAMDDDDDDAISVIFESGVSLDVQREYMRVLTPLLRGDFATGGPLTAHADGADVNSAATLAGADITRHRLPDGDEVSRDTWAAMRRDPRKTLLNAGSFSNERIAAELLFRLHWVGVTVSTRPANARGRRSERDVGVALDARITNKHRESSPWITIKYWPPGATRDAQRYWNQHMPRVSLGQESPVIRLTLDIFDKLNVITRPAREKN